MIHLQIHEMRDRDLIKDRWIKRMLDQEDRKDRHVADWRDAKSRFNQGPLGVAKDQSTIKLHLGVSPIATWSDENLHLRISEMRDHEMILTVNTSKDVDR
jgi:hypothetical protein